MPSDSSWFLDHAWAPVSAGVAGVWTHLNSRFRTLDRQKLDAALFKQWADLHEQTFKAYVDRNERAQLQAQDAVTKMYDKLDDLKTLLLERKGN